MSDQMIILLALGILALYVLISMRLSAAVQPSRLLFASRLEDALADDQLSERYKEELRFIARNLFSRKAAWLIVIMLPIAAVSHLVSHALGRKDEVRSSPNAAESARGLIMNGVFLMLANSPLAAFIFLVEAMLVILFSPLMNVLRLTVDQMDELVGSGLSRNNRQDC